MAGVTSMKALAGVLQITDVGAKEDDGVVYTRFIEQILLSSYQ